MLPTRILKVAINTIMNLLALILMFPKYTWPTIVCNAVIAQPMARPILITKSCNFSFYEENSMILCDLEKRVADAEAEGEGDEGCLDLNVL